MTRRTFLQAVIASAAFAMTGAPLRIPKQEEYQEEYQEAYVPLPDGRKIPVTMKRMSRRTDVVFKRGIIDIDAKNVGNG